MQGIQILRKEIEQYQLLLDSIQAELECKFAERNFESNNPCTLLSAFDGLKMEAIALLARAEVVAQYRKEFDQHVYEKMTKIYENLEKLSQVTGLKMSKHVLSSLKQNGFLHSSSAGQKSSEKDRKSTSSVNSYKSSDMSDHMKNSMANDENRKPSTSSNMSSVSAASYSSNYFSSAALMKNIKSHLTEQSIKTDVSANSCSITSSFKLKGKSFVPISSTEFLNLPIHIRGKATAQEVNEAYLIMWEYFAKNPRMTTLTPVQMSKLGIKAGRTSEAKLKVLKSIGFIKVDTSNRVSLLEH